MREIFLLSKGLSPGLHCTALLSCSDNYHVVVTDCPPPPPAPPLSYVCSNFSGADISCNDSRKWMVVESGGGGKWRYIIILTVAPLQYSLLLPSSGQSTLNPLSQWAARLHLHLQTWLVQNCQTNRWPGKGREGKGRSITRAASPLSLQCGWEMPIVQFHSSQLWRSFFTLQTSQLSSLRL